MSKVVKCNVVVKEDIHSLIASHIVKELTKFHGNYVLRMGKFTGIDLKSILGLISYAIKEGTKAELWISDSDKGILEAKALLGTWFKFIDIDTVLEE